MDYHAAVWSFLLFLAGLIALLRGRMDRQSGWGALGCLLLLATILRICPLIWSSEMLSRPREAVSVFLMVLSACFALIAARRFSSTPISEYLALIPFAFGLILWFTLGATTVPVAVRWVIWAPAFGFLAWKLYFLCEAPSSEESRWSRLTAGGLFLLALLNPAPKVYYAVSGTSHVLSDFGLAHSTMLWSLLNGTACVFLLVGGWFCFHARRTAVISIDHAWRRRDILLGILLALVLAAGWWWTESSSTAADREWRKGLTDDAELVSSAIDPQLIRQLTGNRSDTTLPAYQAIKESLASILKTGSGYRFSYLMAMKDGQVIFLVDNEPPDSKDESFAGDVYAEASAALRAAFHHPGSFTEGPLGDEWGVWVSGFAQVPGIKINGLPVYLGLDHNAADWGEKMARLRQERMLVMVILGCLVVGLFMINYITSEGKVRQAASEERLRLSLHGAKLLSWELDIPTQMITINPGANKRDELLSWPPRLSAHEFLSLVHPDDLERAKMGFAKIFQNSTDMVEIELRVRQPSGEFVWVLGRGRIIQRDTKGEGLRAAGLMLDISERKGNELDLLRSQEESRRLALVAENTTSAVIIAKASGHIEWVNAGFTQITGYTLEEVLGKKPGDVLQGEKSDPEVVDRMKAALSKGEGFVETLLNYTKDGGTYWIAIECQPLFDHQDKLTGFMAIEIDVTRQIEAEKALESQRHHLQQINETLLKLGNSYEENFMKLTMLAAHVLHADGVLYCGIESDRISIRGRYGMSDGMPTSIAASESLYAEVILGDEHFLCVQNPSCRGTKDPGIEEFQTYIGVGVHLSGEVVGSLNILFKNSTELSPDLHECLIIIAQAMGREELLHENRRRLDALSALEATERNRLTTLLRSIDDAVLVEDQKGVITYANPAFEKMFVVAFPIIRGISLEAVLKKISPFFTKPEEFLSSVNAVLADGKTTLRQVFETVDGRYLTRDFIPIVSNGIPYGNLWHYRDITRITRHQLLLETVANVGQLVLNTPLNSGNAWKALVALLGKKTGLDRVRIVRFHRDSQDDLRQAQVIAEWNRANGDASYHAEENVMSYEATEFPEYWKTEFLNGRCVSESGEGIHAAFLKALGTRTFLSIPLTVEARLWGTIGLHYIRREYEWQEEEITLLESAASLISSRLDLQESEKALLEAKNAADQASRAKSTFLATMSHEIRTPLNAVIGISSLLLETKLEPQQRDYAATVASSGEILLELINDILDYSKIEAGKIEVEKMPFSLVDVLVEPLEILARPIAEKKIDLSYFMDTALPPVVVGDCTRLKQVLLNLISNAVKFTEEGFISVRCEPAGDTLVRFLVRDSGIGMNDEVKGRLFEPFMQADSSVTRKYGGTGLGLAISKRLIELMGGAITVESKPGEGTLFTFEIPLPAGESPSSNAPVRDAALVGKRVLIVDDNAVNRLFLHDQLEMWGMNPLEVEGSMEALKLLKSDKKMTLALLDYQMPGLDGVELARAIKAIPHCKALPLILLSSVIEQVTPVDEWLFSAALTKPLRITQLLEAISSALGSGKEKSGAKEALPAKSSKLRVLVAEDNLTNQKVIKMMLTRCGVEPILVENGLQALEAIKNKTFDLALIDIQMPVMDGLEAARKMREYFGTGVRPEIIALTANAFKEDREACFTAGMDGYLVKPLTLDRLRSVIEVVATRVRNGENI